MNIIRFVKHILGQIGYSLLAHAPPTWEKKFSILADVMATDWQRMRKTAPLSMEFLKEPDLEKLFGGLDEDSMSLLHRFVAKLHLLTDSPHLYTSPPLFAFPWSGLCTREEFEQALSELKQLEKLKSRYHLQHAECSSLIHHHGLRFLPGKVLAYLQDSVCIDAGAFEGDSTLVFLQYHPRVVWAFEPSPPNQKLFLNAMHANGVPAEKYHLFAQGLSDKNATIHFSASANAACSLGGSGRCKAGLVPLDSLVPPARIGLIKADLEGMGMHMLRGAVQTIRRDKPILALSIYHNADEFLNTYPFLKSLGLSYEYKVMSLCPPWENHELTLLGWPRDFG